MSRHQEANQPAVYPGPETVSRPWHIRPCRCCSWPKKCFSWSFLGTIFTVGVVLLIIWGAITPSDPQLYVERTQLSTFNLSDASLDYNLTLDISFRNSNRGAGICYRWNELALYYDNLLVTTSLLPRFCQGRKNTTIVTVVFAGRSPVDLTPTGAGFFQTQHHAGIFVVDVRFYGRIRSRLGSTQWKYTDNLDSMCWMMVPLERDGGRFARTKCYDIRPPPNAGV